MAKVCGRCSTMYTESSTVCPKDGTPLGLPSVQVDEDTLVLTRDEAQIVRTSVRSKCQTCSSYFPEWLSQCPRDGGTVSVSIGNRVHILQKLVSDPHVAMFSGKEVFLERDVSVVVLAHASNEVNTKLASFFSDAALLFKAEPLNMGLLEDGRPYAVFAAKRS